MNGIQLSKCLGPFSLGLGTLGVLASRRVARALRVGSPVLVQAFGAREVAAALGRREQKALHTARRTRTPRGGTVAA